MTTTRRRGLLLLVALALAFVALRTVAASRLRGGAKSEPVRQLDPHGIALEGSCAVDTSQGSPAAVFDAVYARGFRPVPEWETVKPFEVRRDRAGNVIITEEMVAHYYKWENIGTRFSLSGGGSEPAAAARGLAFLDRVIEEYGIRSVLDAPCGDVNWQTLSQRVDRLDAFAGLDVAAFPIELSRARFSHHSNKVFAQWDFGGCPFPRWRRVGETGSPTPFDLIHMRDVIQHMPMQVRYSTRCLAVSPPPPHSPTTTPLQVSLRAIQHVVASGAKYLVTTTWQGKQYVNKDDRKSDAFYENNLAAEPFNFPTPLLCVRSHAPGQEEDHTCLYDVAQVSVVASQYAIEDEA